MVSVCAFGFDTEKLHKCGAPFCRLPKLICVPAVFAVHVDGNKMVSAGPGTDVASRITLIPFTWRLAL